jgi:hypothetical protein
MIKNLKTRSIPKMIRNRTFAFLCLAGICAACPGAEAFFVDVGQFQYMRNLTPPSNAPAGIVSFKLDEEVFARTDDSYANMRIFDLKNAEVPFLVRVAKQTVPVFSEDAVRMSTISFEKQEDNKIEIVVESVSNEVSPFVVAVMTNQKNYEKQVTVSGSRDCLVWDVLALNAPIFDYSKYIDLRNNRIEIKPDPYKYYKVEISNFSESHKSPLISIVREKQGEEITREIEESTLVNEEFKVEEIRFLEKKETLTEKERVIQSHSVHNLTVTNDEERHETMVVIDVRRSPLTSLEVFARDANYSRSVRVYGTDTVEEKRAHRFGGDDADQHLVASSVISKVELSGYKHDRTTIRFDRPQRYQRYRIVIENLDSPALNVYGVKAEGEVHEAFFFCDPKHQYKLLYGAVRDMEPPRYDLGDVLDKTVLSGVGVCTLGPEEKNPSASAATRGDGRQIVTSRRLLVGAMLLMVGTLVWLIAVAASGVNKTKPE